MMRPQLEVPPSVFDQLCLGGMAIIVFAVTVFVWAIH